MNAYEQAPEELKFIVRNVEEWPSDEVRNVYITYFDNRINFLGGETDLFNFCAKEELINKIEMVLSCTYTREQYETAREAYVKMNYKPEVGDLVDVVCVKSGNVIKGAKINYISNHVVVYGAYGVENHAAISTVVIAQHTTEPTTQELMFEEWIKSSLDNAHDTMSSGVYLGDVLDVLASNGWVKGG